MREAPDGTQHEELGEAAPSTATTGRFQEGGKSTRTGRTGRTAGVAALRPREQTGESCL